MQVKHCRWPPCWKEKRRFYLRYPERLRALREIPWLGPWALTQPPQSSSGAKLSRSLSDEFSVSGDIISYKGREFDDLPAFWWTEQLYLQWPSCLQMGQDPSGGHGSGQSCAQCPFVLHLKHGPGEPQVLDFSLTIYFILSPECHSQKLALKFSL